MDHEQQIKNDTRKSKPHKTYSQ